MADFPQVSQIQSVANGSDEEMIDLKHYLHLVWHWAWLLLIVMVASGCLAFFVSRQMTPVYESTTNIMVIDAANKTLDYNAVLSSERQTRTYSNMMMNEAVLQTVIDELHLANTPLEMEEFITVEPVRDTQLINVTVEGTDPLLIADIANTLVEVFIQKIKTVQSERFTGSKASLLAQLNEIESLLDETKMQQQQAGDSDEKDRLDTKVMQYQQIYASLLTNYEQANLAEAQSVANVIQINTAQPPLEPVRPRVLVNTAVAALLGLFLAAGIIFLFDALDDTIRTPDQVTQALGLPLLGIILKHDGDGSPITEEQPRSPISESFRLLRTNIQFSNIDDRLHSIIVTSPLPGEGKSLVSSNLAVALAQSGRQVILLDADLRRPTIHKRMKISSTPGMTTALVKPDIVFDGILHTTRTRGLYAIPCGDLPPNPNEMLGSQKMKSFMERLEQHSDMLVLDSAPVLAVADPAVLAQIVDGVVLVLRPGSTSLSAARQAVAQLRQVNANILGIVLNGVNVRGSQYGYYYRKGYFPAEKYYGVESGKVSAGKPAVGVK